MTADRIDILIVEDSKIISSLIEKQLIGMGYNVIGIAETYEETIIKVERCKPLIVLMDVIIRGDLDGIDTAEMLKNKYDIPVIYLTSNTDRKTINRAKKTDPYGYMVKPHSEVDLFISMELAVKRIQLEKNLKINENKYHNLFVNSKDAIYIRHENGAIIECNRSMYELFGYTQQELMEIPIENLFLHVDEFKEEARLLDEHGYIKNLELKMKKKDGTEISCLKTVSAIDDINGKGKKYQGIMKEMTPIREKADEDLYKSLKQLSKVIHGIIDAMIKISEVRDPYTAGHQRNVAVIARAIAEDMGLDNDQIEGIVIAGQLHDIGKMYVPAEILSKPGKLIDLEFALIKTHTLVGYEILKSIDFQWPIAMTVLQHHERVNGSGYPLGIEGKDMLLEAKIIAVADVVDAMISHRPFRPGLGIDLAFEELQKNQGILYDSAVVDSCINVIKRKGKSDPAWKLAVPEYVKKCG